MDTRNRNEDEDDTATGAEELPQAQLLVSAASTVPTSILKDRSRSPKQDMRRSRHSSDSVAGSCGASPVPKVSFDTSAVQGECSSTTMHLSDSELHKALQFSLRQRRTSLPASMLNKPAQQGNVAEARGLLVDLLARPDLAPAVVSCLKVVSALLTAQTPSAIVHTDLGLPLVVDNPWSGEQVVLSGTGKSRVSNITFSTVTSATGLPTIAAEPSRPRSSSYWKPHERESVVTNATPANCTDNELSKETATDEGRCRSYSEPTTTAPRAQVEERSHVVLRPTSKGKLREHVHTADGTVYNTIELDTDPDLKRITEWGFPIFHLADHHRNTTLSRVAYAVFKHSSLFRIFKLSLSKFFNFFHALERGYWNVPYHNRVHAADVLHGCFYLTVHPVRALLGQPSSPGNRPTTSLSPISDSMSTLELMALYTAAAMHDFDHPGRTNAFLVAVEDRKAILYNDRSVLENHHAAESWRLLCASENCFIDSLDAAETKRFRYLVLEYILATDLKQHFDIILQFNEKCSVMELDSESDRVLLCEMVIKLADINSPSKPYRLHRQWTDRICEEFYEQGDEEKKRGLSVSPYMDRTEPSVAKLQDSFIAHIVSPLAVAMNEAGLLPVLPGLEEPELLINLKHNHQKWLRLLDTPPTSEPPSHPDRPHPSEHCEESDASSCERKEDSGSGSLGRAVEIQDSFEMCTIQENGEDEEYL